MSHHSSYFHITVIVCALNEFLSRFAVVAGLLVRSHDSPNLHSSPIPLVMLTVPLAPMLISYFLCVARPIVECHVLLFLITMRHRAGLVRQ